MRKAILQNQDNQQGYELWLVTYKSTPACTSHTRGESRLCLLESAISFNDTKWRRGASSCGNSSCIKQDFCNIYIYSGVYICNGARLADVSSEYHNHIRPTYDSSKALQFQNICVCPKFRSGADVSHG
jgi:hypothetical protein